MDNPQYVAIQCQKKGFLAPTGEKKDGYKEWKLTKTGFDYAEGLVGKETAVEE